MDEIPRVVELIREAAEQQERLADRLDAARTRLPLRYLRQQAHYTTPADNEAMARKAVEAGTRPVARMMERLEVQPSDLADVLGVPGSSVASLLDQPERAPLVMLDAEDAVSREQDSISRAVEIAATILATADWGPLAGGTLRFFRPSGFQLRRTATDIFRLFDHLRDSIAAGNRPIDGIIFPKIEQVSEVELLFEILGEAERHAGLPVGQTKVAFLIESGWAAARILDIAAAASSRLSALVFGIVDYAADLGLPRIANDHPLADWARAAVVNAAGALRVPAIDGMTLAYPVITPGVPTEAARLLFLERMAEAHRDARRAQSWGMAGKWVGHPAQLFAVLLAFRAGVQAEAIDDHVERLAEYRDVVQKGRGAAMIAGSMADRATDRHSRAILRQAVALGQLDPEVAFAAGVVSREEMVEARGLSSEAGRLQADG